MRETRTDVLVVGAGPVGLISALLLAEAGVATQIVDNQEGIAARSYACALHPRTLQLLHQLGLASALVEQGRKVKSVAFYDGNQRVAELNLTKLGGDFPFLLIVPQNVLEGKLEQRLREKGIGVHWNHRCADLQQHQDAVQVTIERLTGTSTGYIVPHWETVVQKRFEVGARFVIGADGHNSLVRSRLSIESTALSAPAFFAAYEFEAGQPAQDEVKVVLDQDTTNVLWPFQENKHRWTFQMVRSGMSEEFPEKERRAVRIIDASVDEGIRQYVEKVAAHRAPWFDSGVTDVTWSTDLVFENRLVKSFGKGRVWLIGDAAHQTGPVGAQSMNVGMQEAKSLVDRIAKAIKAGTDLASLETFNDERRKEWELLLGVQQGLKPGTATSPWVRERLSRLLPCIPGSGDDLQRLLQQWGVVVA